mmetsp:Transcript_84628/g.168072  ORF Transcript_84628/g.168072 Transcript_84628/m.168072 type:complete len:89 (+) Transcript_84628:1-267(+)
MDGFAKETAVIQKDASTIERENNGATNFRPQDKLGRTEDTDGANSTSHGKATKFVRQGLTSQLANHPIEFIVFGGRSWKLNAKPQCQC